MRSLTSLVGVLVTVASVGCGGTVNIGDGDDASSGEGGSGGGGPIGFGGNGPGPVGPTSSSTGTVLPTNPANCPAVSPTLYDESCPQDGLACSYLEEAGCTVSYACTWAEDCYGGGYGGSDYGDDDGGTSGGYSSGSGCYEYTYWSVTNASCNPAAVDCNSAVAGDVCATPGEYCSGDSYECSYEDKYCGDDHRWNVDTWEDECCYDECCYGQCECQPYSCPSELPSAGDYCDPCWDSEYCSYEIQSECGIVPAYAECDPDQYAWRVEVDTCDGTSSSVSVTTGSGPSGSGSSGTGGSGGGFGK